MIPEALPGLKELTGAVEEHWTHMIHEAIAQQAKIGIPHFEKAHVHIRITTPRGTNNRKVWDTSNRAINVIINNLKGIFFDDDDFEHMSCSVDASWGETGMTEVRICNHKDLKKYNVFQSKRTHGMSFFKTSQVRKANVICIKCISSVVIDPWFIYKSTSWVGVPSWCYGIL